METSDDRGLVGLQFDYDLGMLRMFLEKERKTGRNLFTIQVSVAIKLTP